MVPCEMLLCRKCTFDHRGSTFLMTDFRGSATNHFDYTAYGEIEGRSGSTEFVFMFVGRYGVADGREQPALYVGEVLLGGDWAVY